MGAIALDCQSSPIRVLDTRKDLLDVADLIELCFQDTLDREGFDYLRHIRRAARDARYLQWVPGALETVSMPLYGYVWEENGKVVGNLSLIPFRRGRNWFYMIANVAVHPSFRRRGIARQLTIRALEHIRDHGASAAWLQVRTDNEPAVRLYTSLGFIERACRINWVGENFLPLDFKPPAGWQIQSRLKDQWLRQAGWLKKVYPPEITWNIPLNLKQFQPGFWLDVMRWMNGSRIIHWSACHDGEVAGLISYESTSSYHDTLWFAVSENLPEDVLRSLLVFPLRHAEKRRKGVTMNLPANFYPHLLDEMNFERKQTLSWMEIRYPPRFNL